VRLGFRPGGKLMERAEAEGHAVLTVTPLRVTPQADRQRLRAPRLRADFYEAENAIRTFSAEGGAVAELEPLEPGGNRAKRVLSGKRMTANFHPGAQEVAELTVEEEAKMTDGMRQATAARAVYQGATEMVALRGQPLVWDETARTGGEEIDASLEAGHSQARGRVRTTYYSRETAGGAAPFRRGNAPVFVAADRAALRHGEGAALYEGNARAWQDDNFVRAETIEFDRGERQMLAAGSVRSALYGVEREVEPGRKEVVPVFGSADRMSYTDQSRVVHYEGRVKIQQGTDQIDAAVADATLDEGNKLSRLKASRDVVLTQPGRRGTGDEVEYTAASDTAVLTGDLARVEDREREVTTKGARLTLHLRDARIEAADEGGTRRVRTTHRIQR
jgi:lipopolysaccharide export system protein LptA